MCSAVVSVKTITVHSGSCPHGLPHGACPICSGMGGVGKKNVPAEPTTKPGEMTWNECAAIGAFLRSLKNAKKAQEDAYQRRLAAIREFQNTMMKLTRNLQNFIKQMENIPAAKPIAVIAQKILLPLIKFIHNLPVKFLQTVANMMEKLGDISDKLTAMYGELKLAINKKLSNLSKNIKKKLKSIFEIFSTDNEDFENEEIADYQKQLNKLKNFIHKLETNLMNYTNKNTVIKKSTRTKNEYKQ